MSEQRLGILEIFILVGIGVLIVLFLSGCATVSVVKPDGTEIRYTRWGNQSLESFIMEADGSVLFEKQESENAELYRAMNSLIDRIP